MSKKADPFRVNRMTHSAGDTPYPITDKVAPYIMSGGARLTPRLKGAALPTGDNLFKRGTYVPGDGERMQSGRPGADDHLQYKSRGDSV